MTPKLKISKYVIKRLEQVKAQCSGSLFGLMYQGTLIILGFNVETVNGALKYKHIQNNFPTEVDLCGLVKFGLCTDAEAHMTDILQDIDITDNPILLTCDLGTVVGLKASLFKHGQLQDIPFEIMQEEDIFKQFYVAKLTCDLQLICENTEISIKESMMLLRKRLASGSIAFTIPNTSIYLTGGSSGSNISGIKSQSSMSDLINLSAQTLGENISIKTKKKTQLIPTEYEIIDVKMLLRKTKDTHDENISKSAVKIITDQTSYFTIPLKINALSMVFCETQAISLYDILVESVCRSLRLIEHSLIEQVKDLNETELNVPKMYHFFPQQFGHFFTCIYSSNMTDDSTYLIAKRKKLHNRFNLPLTRPFFRKTNNFIFKDELRNKPLVNTHLGIKNQVPDGKQYIVYGKYSYHHYMQDNMDDNGWGCAYRSLQTLCSWFRWQGYSDRQIPTHKEIQKYLVDVGDKQSSFIGSRQWIGSTEVSMCLNGFFNIDSKIMYVRSGSELSTKSSELAMHFQTQGTPIMIGGGVLAHTILGIDYNSQTGELKFLILDPHYTGSEDLYIIQSKGWCSWKNCDFWDKKAYYNLCMPQKPTIF